MGRWKGGNVVSGRLVAYRGRRDSAGNRHPHGLLWRWSPQQTRAGLELKPRIGRMINFYSQDQMDAILGDCHVVLPEHIVNRQVTSWWVEGDTKGWGSVV